MFSHSLLLFRLTSILLPAALCELDTHFDKHSHHEEIQLVKDGSEDKKHGGLDSASYAKAYTNLLKAKRREQIDAVKNIMAIENKKKQRTFMNELLTKMEKVVRAAKITIDKAGFRPSDSFPVNNHELRDAVANVVENTAFFCEFVLRFPSAIEKMLRNNEEWFALVNWSYEFSSGTNLFDESGQKLLHLAAQQLNLISREENFVNPYDRASVKEKVEREAVRQMDESREERRLKKLKDKKLKKDHKPSLSKSEL